VAAHVEMAAERSRTTKLDGRQLQRELASLFSRFPIDGPPALVNDRDNRCQVTRHNEVDAVWKLAEQRALNWIGDDWKLRRIVGDSIEHDVQLRKQALHKLGTALAVPT
jgi:hypothetical protein